MSNEKIAIVLISEGYGGTERRIGNLFKLLSKSSPSKYHLIINRKLYNSLQKGNYHLEKYRNIHILEKKSVFDFKSQANEGFYVQLGRILTLFHYKSCIKKIIEKNNIRTVQVFLEMVPFLGLFPLKCVRMVASLVSHLPKYYDMGNINCWILLQALKRYGRIDALSSYIADNLVRLGVPEAKINYPKRNFVDHFKFAPNKKEKMITSTARMLSFKNQMLFLDAIKMAIPRIDNDFKFYMLGRGKLLGSIKRQIKKSRLQNRVYADFYYDPSNIINKSLIHVCIEEYDNFTNQSLLEGMSAGCAIIASRVGLTKNVVAPDAGILVKLSEKEISDAMVKLAKNPKLAEQMGRNSRRKILEEHNAKTYLDYIAKVQDFSSKVHILDGKTQNL